MSRAVERRWGMSFLCNSMWRTLSACRVRTGADTRSGHNQAYDNQAYDNQAHDNQAHDNQASR